jgi:Cft2 family RNA processing exonuclease
MMLQGGTSLEVFKAWAPDPKSVVLLPSYQVGSIPVLDAAECLQTDACILDAVAAPALRYIEALAPDPTKLVLLPSYKVGSTTV